MWRGIGWLRRQTAHPPRRATVAAGAATPPAWSARLRPWPDPPGAAGGVPCCVGVEGCRNAFNAMNTIRTSRYFATIQPPTFLNLSAMGEINQLRPLGEETPEAAAREGGARPPPAQAGIALFGRGPFLSRAPPCVQALPIIAVENFASGSRSIHHFRFPSTGCRLVMGHENDGVSERFIPRGPVPGPVDPDPASPAAQSIVYIPQFGTISSLNVVTSLGIALFYASLDTYYPNARTTVSPGRSGPPAAATDSLRAYQQPFAEALPRPGGADAVDAGRVDPRPIHPMFYQKQVPDIRGLLVHFRQELLARATGAFGGAAGDAPGGPRRFGLAVLYGNDVDLRHFGGVVRSANAFLVDHVYYYGRRRFNVVGAIGSHHYTPPVYLGVGPSTAGAEGGDGGESADAAAGRLVEALHAHTGARPQLWLLDCGDTAAAGGSSGGVSPEQRWLAAHRGDPSRCVSLSDSEALLRAAAAPEGVVLVVPPEGQLPPHGLLRRCVRLLTVLPGTTPWPNPGGCGLPSTVACGIALERLGAAMHPALVR